MKKEGKKKEKQKWGGDFDVSAASSTPSLYSLYLLKVLIPIFPKGKFIHLPHAQKDGYSLSDHSSLTRIFRK
jgi:hypothetical protein